MNFIDGWNLITIKELAKDLDKLKLSPEDKERLVEIKKDLQGDLISTQKGEYLHGALREIRSKYLTELPPEELQKHLSQPIQI